MENMEYSLEELIPIVAEIAVRYSGYEHSSIPYEKAQMLMKGVIYCIDEYKRMDSNALLTDHVSAREAYQYGHEIVMDKTRKLRALYNEIMADFSDYGLKCLKSTLTKEISGFLSKYNFNFAPQETPALPDYPVLKDLDGRSGIDFALEYTECIRMEQHFLKKFDHGYVIEILSEYHSDYKELIVNICGIVLKDTVRHIMLGKPLNSGGFDKGELESLKKIMLNKSVKEISDEVTVILKQLTKHYYSDDDQLLEYLMYGIPNVVERGVC